MASPSHRSPVAQITQILNRAQSVMILPTWWVQVVRTCQATVIAAGAWQAESPGFLLVVAALAACFLVETVGSAGPILALAWVEAWQDVILVMVL